MRSMKETSADNTNPHKIKVGDAVYLAGNKQIGMAVEAIADDVATKVGEMERFMEMSSSFMNSIDLQNGVFEEQGMKMLEDYEKNSTLLLLGGKEKAEDVLELKQPDLQQRNTDTQYDGLFNS